jgi:hypothetical protein
MILNGTFLWWSVLLVHLNLITKSNFHVVFNMNISFEVGAEAAGKQSFVEKRPLDSQLPLHNSDKSALRIEQWVLRSSAQASAEQEILLSGRLWRY